MLDMAPILLPLDLDRGANGEPSDAPTHVFGRSGEDAFDLLPSLPEVLPPLVVDRDRGPRPDETAQLDRVLRRHRVASRPGDRKADAAEVQQRDVDLKTLGDLTHPVVQHRVARDPQDPVLLAVPSEREPD